ncbi:MAG: hypothetical protein KA191_07380 [Verrucomicrobia bacterium]|nr:hypothetical protein [Verrucomicrobiota bacterium]OQC65846.1 MAG: hypothetical protein BWX48_02108 [Verrucomicrobia bacterium ADurb.Bin006]NMD21761.1 hypothetical protein [Verrucomicrobiota bacterium]HOA60309.1 hypothetical protein [Verrucomicrobiota bacterium]HOF48047.1 hypothetical protein [Verrucomicrobiota bacterium]
MSTSSLMPLAVVVSGILPIVTARADDGRLLTRMSNWTMTLQIDGDADDDWRFQGSIDLSTWTDLRALGTLLSGRANAPVRSVGIPVGAMSCNRAVRTAVRSNSVRSRPTAPGGDLQPTPNCGSM